MPQKSRHHCDKYLQVLSTLNDRFQEALDYRLYRLVDKSFYYDDKVIRSVSKSAKRLQVQVKSQKLDSLDPISILSFFPYFNWCVIRMGYTNGKYFSCYNIL